MTDPDTPDAGPAVFRAARQALSPDGDYRIVGVRHADGNSTIDMLILPDSPQPGLTTYSTLDLHEHPNVVERAGGSRDDLRVELFGVAPSDQPTFRDALAEFAFELIRDGRDLAAGSTWSFLDRAGLDSEMNLLTLGVPAVAPELASVEVSDALDVHWLWAIPVHESDLAALLFTDASALLEVWQDAGLDYWDLRRPPLDEVTSVAGPADPG